MCIRDRVNSFIAKEALESEMTVVRNEFESGENDPTSILMAVSYTHLRAHETVLDLVCRLLLEKKNNKHKTINIHLTISVHPPTSLNPKYIQYNRYI